MFEFNLNQNELEALDTLLTTCLDSEVNMLPAWNFMGQDIWKMDFNVDAVEITSTWAAETADVA
ncbi:MAG: hypothetical protein H0X30_01090 [Anaerolineae bacterium]|nr:hypothetical protein [Anaerolineae bacterium]